MGKRVLGSFSLFVVCHKSRDDHNFFGDRRLICPLTGVDDEPSTPLLPQPAIPMNSKSVAVESTDILRLIMELLPPADLARAACVCRAWSEVASEREVLENSFTRPWKIRRIVGDPSSNGFWRHPGIRRFAISHRIRKGDSVASLALKYDVQVIDIKRLNNMMSDHGIYSRDRLLIPIYRPELLHDSTCYIELDVDAKREVAVLYLDGHPGADYLARQSQIITEAGRKKILNSVRRSMGVNDGTAEYYLSISSGDPRAAMLQYAEDLRWELEQRRRAL